MSAKKGHIRYQTCACGAMIFDNRLEQGVSELIARSIIKAGRSDQCHSCLAYSITADMEVLDESSKTGFFLGDIRIQRRLILKRKSYP